MADYQKLLKKTYKETKKIKGGRKAHYIPELAKVDSKLFGISICDVKGNLFSIGDHNKPIAIESISKLLSLAFAIKKHGIKTVHNKIGMHGSFLPFNSILAAKLSPSLTINPFLNQGAMATTSLLYQKNLRKYKDSLVKNMSNYASKSLQVGRKIYASESKTNDVNMSLAYLLKSEDRFYAPVEPSVDAYTYQCSVVVTSDNLARMASVFANGGINPTNHKRLLSKNQTAYILNNLLPEGLYEYSDDWIARTGGRAYAKSGVGGGILIVIPGICGIGIISPPLDKHGNSVKGIAAGVKLARVLARRVFSECGKTKKKSKKKKKNSKKKSTRKRRK